MCATRTTLLSPFDPIVWHGAWALELYDFHYRVEIYKPAAQRTYGYFTLPILPHDRVIGRLDPKALRVEGRFKVRNLHLEPWVTLDDELVAGLASTITACAAWHKTR